jgi:hypothetical protein
VPNTEVKPSLTATDSNERDTNRHTHAHWQIWRTAALLDRRGLLTAPRDFRRVNGDEGVGRAPMERRAVDRSRLDSSHGGWVGGLPVCGRGRLHSHRRRCHGRLHLDRFARRRSRGSAHWRPRRVTTITPGDGGGRQERHFDDARSWLICGLPATHYRTRPWGASHGHRGARSAISRLPLFGGRPSPIRLAARVTKPRWLRRPRRRRGRFR